MVRLVCIVIYFDICLTAKSLGTYNGILTETDNYTIGTCCAKVSYRIDAV